MIKCGSQTDFIHGTGIGISGANPCLCVKPTKRITGSWHSSESADFPCM